MYVCIFFSFLLFGNYILNESFCTTTTNCQDWYQNIDVWIYRRFQPVNKSLLRHYISFLPADIDWKKKFSSANRPKIVIIYDKVCSDLIIDDEKKSGRGGIRTWDL